MIGKTLKLTALMSVLAVPALAQSAVIMNDENRAKVREVLTEQGYEVGKVKLDDGLYEAYARKDGKKFEIYLDGDFAVVRTEEDD